MKHKPPLQLQTKLYLSFCIDAIMAITKEDAGLDEKLIEVIEPLLEELFSDVEILA